MAGALAGSLAGSLGSPVAGTREFTAAAATTAGITVGAAVGATVEVAVGTAVGTTVGVLALAKVISAAPVEAWGATEVQPVPRLTLNRMKRKKRDRIRVWPSRGAIQDLIAGERIGSDWTIAAEHYGPDYELQQPVSRAG